MINCWLGLGFIKPCVENCNQTLPGSIMWAPWAWFKACWGQSQTMNVRRDPKTGSHRRDSLPISVPSRRYVFLMWMWSLSLLKGYLQEDFYREDSTYMFPDLRRWKTGSQTHGHRPSGACDIIPISRGEHTNRVQPLLLQLGWGEKKKKKSESTFSKVPDTQQRVQTISIKPSSLCRSNSCMLNCYLNKKNFIFLCFLTKIHILLWAFGKVYAS